VPALGQTGPVAAFAPDGTLVALLADDGPRARSLLVLAG
jgi:tRNA pseudouridine55 synthase